jgi:peptidoglycan/LPS O-acetylase OafA/YrhL
LLVVQPDAAIGFDDRNLIVLGAAHKRFRTSWIARAFKASSLSASLCSDFSAPIPISARQAATLPLTGAVGSIAIVCRILTGSQLVTSTPSSALADASARVGRPPRRFGTSRMFHTGK